MRCMMSGPAMELCSAYAHNECISRALNRQPRVLLSVGEIVLFRLWLGLRTMRKTVAGWRWLSCFTCRMDAQRGTAFITRLNSISTCSGNTSLRRFARNAASSAQAASAFGL